MEDKTQAGGGQSREPQWVEQPITDEQLEAAWRELRVFVASDVRWMLHQVGVRAFQREIKEAVMYAFAEAGIRRPGHPRPRAWLRTVAYRRAITQWLKRQREDDVLVWRADVPEPQFEDRLRRGQPASPQLTVEVLEAFDAIASLDDAHRDAIALDIAGYDLDEAAAAMGVDRYEARWLRAEARHQLRRQLRS